jgi:23S rRNA (cytosine1962-C5)-methyltransferase
MSATVIVDSLAAKRLRQGHPWVFSNLVREVQGAPGPGDVVRVLRGEKDLGTALYNPNSLIVLRHLSWEGHDLDGDLFKRRLLQARRLRDRLYPDSDSWRLCHGESDFLPGLVIDRYGDGYVVQSFAAGMDKRQGQVAEVLADHFGAAWVVERNASPLRSLEGLPDRSGLLHGADPGRVEVSIPPARFAVEPLSGQKTGLFLDQRENRWAAARHAKGARVYETHCHAGGFSLHAALAGAESVEAVDSSEPALELARANAELNSVADRCVFTAADAMEDMAARYRRKERFDLVMVDPPSYTRSKKQLPQARRALRELNRRAMTLLESGGVLVSSCCSHHVHEETFLEQLQRAAAEAGRVLRILEKRQQSPDHPMLAAMPESRYLSCVIAEVF